MFFCCFGLLVFEVTRVSVVAVNRWLCRAAENVEGTNLHHWAKWTVGTRCMKKGYTVGFSLATIG